jgi:hypothetical protein
MVTVQAEPLGDAWRCRVAVEHQGERTEHVVTVSRSDLERWGRGGEQKDVEDLVRRSFEFLLEREPPSSILQTFDLSVIQRYFPDYGRIFSK